MIINHLNDQHDKYRLKRNGDYFLFTMMTLVMIQKSHSFLKLRRCAHVSFFAEQNL